MFPALAIGLSSVHVPVPGIQVPAATPPQSGRTMSAAGAVAPPPTIAPEIEIDVQGPALAGPNRHETSDAIVARQRLDRKLGEADVGHRSADE